MLPWVYGFKWSAGYLIFVSAFLLVALAVATTLCLAFLRSWRDLKGGRTPKLRWASAFHDLTAQDRACRHALTMEMPGRECAREFDCAGCVTHAGLIEKISPQLGSGSEEICGLQVPMDRYYHRGHTWVKQAHDKSVLVGLDEIGRRVMGKADRIVRAGSGSRVYANVPAVLLMKGQSATPVLSPIDGELTEISAAGEDWLMKIRPAGGFAHLLRGAEVRAWFLKELDKLQMSAGGGAGARSLADGGVLVDDLSEAFPREDWERLCAETFLET
jgi:hypothetical protein